MAQSFYEVLSKLGPLLALILQASVLYRFWDRRNRDYPLAIVFTLLLFLLTLSGYFFQDLRRLLIGSDSTSFVSFVRTFLLAYSVADLFMHLLLLALMLQLTRATLKSLELGTRILIPLALISGLIGISAYTYFGADLRKNTLLQTRQVVSFWMVLLNLYWWTLLLRKRRLDRRVLLLSAGIGMMMTGQVIGDGIMYLSTPKGFGSLLAMLVIYSTHFACLYAWYNAFHPGNAVAPAVKLKEPLT